MPDYENITMTQEQKNTSDSNTKNSQKTSNITYDQGVGYGSVENLSSMNMKMNLHKQQEQVFYCFYKQQQALVDPKYKTELCKTYISTKNCRYGLRCRFAHGIQDLMSNSNALKNKKENSEQSIYNNNSNHNVFNMNMLFMQNMFGYHNNQNKQNQCKRNSDSISNHSDCSESTTENSFSDNMINEFQENNKKSKIKCLDFWEKGYCLKGAHCSDMHRLSKHLKHRLDIFQKLTPSCSEIPLNQDSNILDSLYFPFKN